MYMYLHLQKVISRKTVGVMKVNDVTAGSGYISQRHGSADPDLKMSPIRNTDKKTVEMFTCCIEKILLYNFDQKSRFTYSYASINDAQAAGEAFIPQRRTSSNLKQGKFLQFFGSFFSLLDLNHPHSLSGFGSSRPKCLWIHADPDPQHWFWA